MKPSLRLLTALLAGATSAFAVDFTTGAALNSGFALSDGTDLSTGSLIRFGTFSISNELISANSSSIAFLNDNFVQLGVATIGQGNPAGGAGANDPVNNGLFNGNLSSINTTASGLNVAGSQLYYWVFNTPTAFAATQHGVFSSTLWQIPSGDGGGLDLASINTDIADLTLNQAGEALATSARIVIGGFGPGSNATGAGRDFTLVEIGAPIPEPSTAVALVGVASLGFAALRRRRRSA